MKPSLQLKLNQQLSMTPELQQAIRLLQLSSVELALEIKNTLESNLVLESLETEEETNTDPIGARFEESALWDASFSISHKKAKAQTGAQPSDWILQKPAEMTLHQYLLWQMELARFSTRERTIAAALIDSISEEGYFLSSFPEVQETLPLKTNPSELESILHRIQSFEPQGIGARTLAECLTLQLDALPAHTPWLTEAKLLVQKHLPILGAKDFRRLQKSLHLNQSALTEVVNLLTTLNPRPGHTIAPQKYDYITPDLLVYRKNGQMVLQLNESLLPKFRMHPQYASMIQSATLDTGLATFKQHLKEAKWLIKSLKTRNETLLKVAQSIFEAQESFFEHGDEAMQPLTLQDIARKVALHESTVSRITMHKTVLTPKGLYELKYFFSNGVPTPNAKIACSTAIRAIIRKCIQDESPSDPFSDHKIVRLLAEQGVQIARRTVTKYREAMRIPVSSKRKVKY